MDSGSVANRRLEGLHLEVIQGGQGPIPEEAPFQGLEIPDGLTLFKMRLQAAPSIELAQLNAGLGDLEHLVRSMGDWLFSRTAKLPHGLTTRPLERSARLWADVPRFQNGTPVLADAFVAAEKLAEISEMALHALRRTENVPRNLVAGAEILCGNACALANFADQMAFMQTQQATGAMMFATAPFIPIIGKIL